jgi:hypothetical protein
MLIDRKKRKKDIINLILINLVIINGRVDCIRRSKQI